MPITNRGLDLRTIADIVASLNGEAGASPITGLVQQWGTGAWDPTSPNNVKVPNLNLVGPAVGDAKWVTDGAITGATKAFTSATAGFAPTDVGKLLLIAGAGAAGGFLKTTISAYVSATAVTTADTATGTVSGVNACFGTDNNGPFQSAINSQQLNGGVISIPAGNFLISAQLIPAPGVFGNFTTSTRPLLIRGAGMGSTVLVAGDLLQASGIFGYGRGGSNPVTAQLLLRDLTLDGNYLGVGGGVIQQPASTAGALLSINAPFTSSATTAPNGRYNVFERVKFYRSTGYVSQGMHGQRFIGCEFESTGQPDIASGGLHYDNLGSGAADAVVIASSWKDCSGNYVDFVSATGTDLIRLIFIGNVSRNHQIGGIYACGNGSIIMSNRLQNMNAGSGIGYDVGTAAGCRSKNIVAHNTLDLLTVNGSGLSFATYGDLIEMNNSSDSSNADFFAPIQAEFGIAFGSGAPAGTGPRINSDGTNIFIGANAAAGGNIYLRTVSGGQRGALVGLYNAGVTQWQTYDDTGAVRNTLDDGLGGMAAKGQVRRGRQTPTEAVLVSGIDANLGSLVGVTLTAARLVGAPLNPAIGQRLTFTLIQGGAGAFAVTWNAVFKKSWVDTGNATGARSTISFVYDGTNWNQDGAQTPYV